MGTLNGSQKYCLCASINTVLADDSSRVYENYRNPHDALPSTTCRELV